jgi:urea carboxylase
MVNGNVDIVEWMILQACMGPRFSRVCPPFDGSFVYKPTGAAVQVRVYAEDTQNSFCPAPGLLQEFIVPETSQTTRVETHAFKGYTINGCYDPMVMKVLHWDRTREATVAGMADLLKGKVKLAGVPTNVNLVRAFIDSTAFKLHPQLVTTKSLEKFASGKRIWLSSQAGEDISFVTKAFEVSEFEIVDPGLSLAVQAWPGRTAQGMWRVGVPPSGPMDHLACRLANVLVGNPQEAAVLESLILGAGSKGPVLRFRSKTVVAVTGAPIILTKTTSENTTRRILKSGVAFEMERNEELHIARANDDALGARAYIALQGGIDVPDYLGSKATFAKGNFGGHQGRELLPGDVLPIGEASKEQSDIAPLGLQRAPQPNSHWTIGVLPGPRGNPEFMLAEDIAMLHSTKWEVHSMSNRFGIRLIGPEPQWSRPDGGEGGSHPSNIHDEVYAMGTINFTGGMPVIITQDGPSLGGFVCPITIVEVELWKVGQVQAGDTIQFRRMTIQESLALRISQNEFIETLGARGSFDCMDIVERAPLQVVNESAFLGAYMAIQSLETQAVLLCTPSDASRGYPGMTVRLAGDRFVLIEYGDMILDLALRVRVHLLEQHILDRTIRPDGLEETAPGVRSLQIRYNPLVLPLSQLLELITRVDAQIENVHTTVVPSRVISLPLHFDSPGCNEAIQKYMASFRVDAPYQPSNIDYIAQNNGLASQKDVEDRLFAASYLCLGLGDVYLGACCAVPLDPRHRMISTKMNPARTWTEEGTVGLGGAYMCIYPMDSPGGYQLAGRTLPVWNTWGHNQPDIFSERKVRVVQNTLGFFQN